MMIITRLVRQVFTRRLTSCSRFLSTNATKLGNILERVRDGSLNPEEAETLISTSEVNPEDTLKTFANIDHHRTRRTGFPEAVFGAGKTPEQVARILDDMARSLNQQIKEGTAKGSQRAILATRVTSDEYDEIKQMPLSQGTLEYNEMARIISMKANNLQQMESDIGDKTKLKRVVVATAGTTDLPVAEEAAVVLEAANCDVDRIYDVGVAGLHRIINALPRLQHPDVGCIIVCAGMDGALPSVVGGLVSVPVLAVPTSIGYGVSLGGIAPMLTMLNTCAPGVGVMNIDNGFGAAALAYKCIRC